MRISRILSSFEPETLRRSFNILSSDDKKKLMAVICIQVFLAAMDLIGIAFTGLLGSIALSGVSSKEPSKSILEILDYLNLNSLNLRQQALILGITITLIMVTKSIASLYFTKRTIFFLSNRGARLSSSLTSKLLSQPLQVIQEKSMMQTMYALTEGVSSITAGVLATGVALIADFSLLIIIAIGLAYVDFVVAICTFLVFASIGMAMYKFLNNRARELGFRLAELRVNSNEKILEVLGSYRELVVRNRRNYYARLIGNEQLNLANNKSEIMFMPQIGKYVIEITLVIGALLICALQFIMDGAIQSISTLAIFLTASARIAPAVLRIQQGAITIKNNLGSASPTLDLIESIGNSIEIANAEDNLVREHADFTPKIEVCNVSVKYEGKSIEAISDISLVINPGSTVAIVGKSGAGKTTLVDSILGVLAPTKGKIHISGETPAMAISKWSGAISYLPQDILIANGTLRDNVTLGYPKESVPDKFVWDVLQKARLEDFARKLPKGLDTYIGDRGAQISGGQRQRLGIARALLTSPKLLVLDEATSALDGETELGISETISELHGDVTVLMIAHRLSTIRNADTIFYLEDGKLIFQGSFDEIRKNIPEFDKQAKLMGL